MPTFKEGTSQKKMDRVTSNVNRQNARIERRNEARVERVTESLNSEFANTTNENGEAVRFDFKVSSLAVDDPSLRNTDLRDVKTMAESMGEQGADGSIAPAVFIATGKPPGNRGIETAGYTQRNVRITFNNFSQEVIAHEVGHSLLTTYPEHTQKGLMTAKTKDQSKITSSEVQSILDDAYEK